MYYNTNNLTGDDLTASHEKTNRQLDIIQDFFNKHPGEKYTASDVEHELKRSGKLKEGVPITSIRRAMTDLKNDGRIDKLDETAVRPHGCNAAEHYYQLSKTFCPAGYSEIQQTDYAQDTHD